MVDGRAKYIRNSHGESIGHLSLREDAGRYPREIEVAVFFDDSVFYPGGEIVGTLTYTEERYNRRRVHVVKKWTARTASRKQVGTSPKQTVALALLLAATGHPKLAEALA